MVFCDFSQKEAMAITTGMYVILISVGAHVLQTLMFCLLFLKELAPFIPKENLLLQELHLVLTLTTSVAIAFVWLV